MLNLFRRKKTHQAEQTAELQARVAKTHASLGGQLQPMLAAATTINADLLEEIETVLLGADLVRSSQRIMQAVEAAWQQKIIRQPLDILPAIQAELFDIIETSEQYLAIDNNKKPYVILMVGVNGVGKTTTIGKLAQRFREDGLRVMLAAGDTFRAAAAEQLQVWGERNQVPVVAQQAGADPAAVIFDALESAAAKNIDVLICDTAGRLHTQGNLMAELEKIQRVIKRKLPDAPHEVMLVVDASTGQNALHQAREFNKAVKLTGITITKLDGTARGGVLFAIAQELQLPIRFVGLGEQAKDLRPFDATNFIDAILPLAEPASS